MRTTYDAEADAAYIEPTSGTRPGRSVRNVEVDAGNGSSVVLDFDSTGVLLGVEVLSASRALDAEFLAGAEQISEQ